MTGHAILAGKIDYSKCEDGIITSWNDKYIFVDYGKNCGRGTATSPEDLEFVNSQLRESHGPVLIKG